MSEKNVDEKVEETIIDKIDKFIATVIGLKTNTELSQLLTKLTTTKAIIENAYQIGDFIEKYEQYKQKKLTTDIIQGITDKLMPQFQEYLVEKYQQEPSNASTEAEPK